MSAQETFGSLNTEEDSNERTVSSEVYEDLKFYFQYASSAYHVICLRPNGNHLVNRFANLITDVQGFVARDSERKEIVVAIRGSTSPIDVLIDASVLMIPFVSPGVLSPDGAKVHSGFLIAWNSVSVYVVNTVRKQLEKYPDHTIVTTGHSLGGAMALLAGVTMQQSFPDNEVRIYTYGAPRTGNKALAEFVNKTFGDRASRVVHTNDGVPTMVPTILGYHHHGREYWLHDEPPCPENTTRCSADGEDPACSASVRSRGVCLAHTMYFGILASTPFCL